MALEIINKSGLKLPDYVPDLLRRIAWRAHIAPAHIRLVIEKRHGQRKQYPSGTYRLDCKTVVVRIGSGMRKEDFAFVLAHEIGHLKAHLEAKPIEKFRRLTYKDYGETKATHFALKVCNCYPVAAYSGTKRRVVKPK